MRERERGREGGREREGERERERKFINFTSIGELSITIKFFKN
jgi:hypothetical protein